MQSVKFPYGISNIEKLIEQDFVFVDKTNYIELLEKEENYSIFLRPRRMGKSLFISMLEYYYDVLKKDKFDKIFSKLYIGKNPTPMASSYRVLKFDFSGIDTQNDEKTYKFFLDVIREAMSTFMGRYQLFSEQQQRHILEGDSPGNLLRRFFETLNLWKTHTGDELKIYILIDEYDHFTNEILIRDLSEFKRSVTQDGYIRKFYEAIKIATQQGFVDRFFITGVSPITLDGLTSGFNIGSHLSGLLNFNDLMGFTQAEVKHLLDMVLVDKSSSTDIINDLKRWYNGYRFNIDVDHTIYNSDMVLYFVKQFALEQKYPAQMLDPNIMPDYQKIKKLFRVVDMEEKYEVLRAILEQGEISTRLIYQFTFEQPFDKMSFTNLLYYLGNLTLKGKSEYGIPIFIIPNYVIKDIFWQFYANLLQETAGLYSDSSKVKDAILSTAAGDIGPFLLLVQKLLEVFSNRDFQRFDEKYVKGIIMAYAFQAEFYVIRSEREITNDGYLDIEFLQHPALPGIPHQYAIELKYLKQANENQLQSTMLAAKSQLKSYLEKDAILKSLQRLKAVAIVVMKDKVYWEEVI